MIAFISAHPAPALLIALALGIAAAGALAALIFRRYEARQARAFGRLRRDSERPARAVVRRGENLSGVTRQIDALSEAMESRQDRFRRSMDERMELMNQANERRLEQMQELVGDKLDGRISASFRVVNGQLADVHRGLGEMRELALGVTELRKLMGGVKTRGVWGEAQLRGLMEQLFAPGQYVENAAIPAGSQTRVEFALKLPGAGGGDALLPIDSKFPREDYLRLVEAAEAEDPERVRRCAAQLERAVFEQAKLIHDKYIRPPETADFAVMFLPTESLYAEVARREGLIERAQERFRVVIAGPATLCALLTSVRMGLRTCALEKRSGEVLATLAGMKRDFDSLDESIQRMRQRLNLAQNELDALENRTRKALRAINSVEDGGAQ